MINIKSIKIKNGHTIGIEINYPKTRLLSITVQGVGYIMCGALNIKSLDILHKDREIIAARITGVRTFSDLLQSEIKEITEKASEIGIKYGMTGMQALEKMSLLENNNN